MPKLSEPVFTSPNAPEMSVCEVGVPSKLSGLITGLFDYRHHLLQGSTRSGKSFAITIAICAQVLSQKLTVLACRAELVNAKRTLYPDFVRVLEMMGKADQYTYNATEGLFTFKNGSTIRFAATTDIQKLRGLRSDIAWFNEATEILHEAFQQISQRCRGVLILDYNPSYNSCWAYDLKSHPKTRYYHTTYKDNPFISDAEIAQIESYRPCPENDEALTSDPYMWKIYGLGLPASRSGLIFPPFDIVPDSEYPKHNVTSHHLYGLDFGFANSKTACVELAVHNSVFYLRELVYETGLPVAPNHHSPQMRNLSDLLEEKGVRKDLLISADSASPESIKQLTTSGFNIAAVKKYPGSVLDSLSKVQSYTWKVTESSLGLRHELENYHWKVKPGGAIDAAPEKVEDDLADSIRYCLMHEFADNNRTPKADIQYGNTQNMRTYTAKGSLGNRINRFRRGGKEQNGIYTFQMP